MSTESVETKEEVERREETNAGGERETAEGAVEDGDEKEPDMGLRLTCSLRNISRRQYQLENPPDGGLRAWLQGVFSLFDDSDIHLPA